MKTYVDGETYILYHSQSCCESVTVEDICGDTKNLIGSPITLAEESTSEKNPPGFVKDYQSSFTWTFYRLATIMEITCTFCVLTRLSDMHSGGLWEFILVKKSDVYWHVAKWISSPNTEKESIEKSHELSLPYLGITCGFNIINFDQRKFEEAMNELIKSNPAKTL